MKILTPKEFREKYLETHESIVSIDDLLEEYKQHILKQLKDGDKS